MRDLSYFSTLTASVILFGLSATANAEQETLVPQFSPCPEVRGTWIETKGCDDAYYERKAKEKSQHAPSQRAAGQDRRDYEQEERARERYEQDRMRKLEAEQEQELMEKKAAIDAVVERVLRRERED